MAVPHPDLLEFEQACVRLREALRGATLGTEVVPLSQACGRVLAHDLSAPRDVPGFTHAAMDGYAVRGADLQTDADTTLRVADRVLAGETRDLILAPHTCAYIATGAPLPRGADTVVIVEHAQRDADLVRLRPGTLPGANVRAAHDDYAFGTMALTSGTRLSPAQLGVAASFGCVQLDVVRQPRVAVLTTGDELRPPGERLAYGQRHDSNRVVLEALLARYGCAVVRSAQVCDDAETLRDTLLAAAAQADVIVTTGGVSAGVADLLPALLAQHGEVVLWKVRMRPGMPMLVGRWGRAWLFALPGNPVSVMATFRLFVLPALFALAGADTSALMPQHARLREAVRKPVGRMDFRRANLTIDDQAQLWASVHPSVSSGALRSMAESTALVALAASRDRYDAGEVVEVYRFHDH
jgi:molybdopterin molybdotransferase